VQRILDLVDVVLSELSRQPPSRGTVEWYLEHHLLAFRRYLLRASSAGDVWIATTALDRFCRDSLDTGSDLYRKCAEIVELASKLSGRR
jgi:hypothetical protein